MRVSISELKTKTGKFVAMAETEDILITKNGRVVAKLVTAKADKRAALDKLLSLFPKGVEVDIDRAREERLR